MIITLVRHAEVEEVYKNCYNGHINIGLSQHGHKQSKELAKKIDIQNFDAVYSSDLLRCRETLSYFQKDANIVFTSLLREKSWGRHEGMSYDAIIKRENIKYKNFQQWLSTLDGEEYPAFQRKIEYFFFTYLPKRTEKNVLIVTHAGVIRTLISMVQNVTLEKSFGTKLLYGGIIIYDTRLKTISLTL